MLKKDLIKEALLRELIPNKSAGKKMRKEDLESLIAKKVIREIVDSEPDTPPMPRLERTFPLGSKIAHRASQKRRRANNKRKRRFQRRGR